jgi:hypothetical protein
VQIRICPELFPPSDVPKPQQQNGFRADTPIGVALEPIGLPPPGTPFRNQFHGQVGTVDSCVSSGEFTR